MSDENVGHAIRAANDQLEPLIQSAQALDDHVYAFVEDYVEHAALKATDDKTPEDKQLMAATLKGMRKTAKTIGEDLTEVRTELRELAPTKRRKTGASKGKKAKGKRSKTGCNQAQLTTRGRRACSRGRKVLNETTGRYLLRGHRTHKTLCNDPDLDKTGLYCGDFKKSA
jgi:hypothetical protein